MGIEDEQIADEQEFNSQEKRHSRAEFNTSGPKLIEDEVKTSEIIQGLIQQGEARDDEEAKKILDTKREELFRRGAFGLEDMDYYFQLVGFHEFVDTLPERIELGYSQDSVYESALSTLVTHTNLYDEERSRLVGVGFEAAKSWDDYFGQISLHKINNLLSDLVEAATKTVEDVKEQQKPAGIIERYQSKLEYYQTLKEKFSAAAERIKAREK